MARPAAKVAHNMPKEYETRKENRAYRKALKLWGPTRAQKRGARAYRRKYSPEAKKRRAQGFWKRLFRG